MAAKVKHPETIAKENRLIRGELTKIADMLKEAAMVTLSLVQPATPKQLRIQTTKIRSARERLCKLHESITIKGKGRQ